MSQVVAMTGNATIKINGRVLNNLANGDCLKVTTPNDIMAVKTGKNQNSLFALNAPGNQGEVEIRLVRGSDDDKFMQSLYGSMVIDPPSFVLMVGEFTQRLGDGTGDITNDVYSCTGGVFKKRPEMMENVEGETEQAVTLWTLLFSVVTRSIG